MIRLVSFVLLSLAAGLSSSFSRADDFTIELQARDDKAGKSAEAHFPTANAKPEPRIILTTAVNSAITVKWTARNGNKSSTVKDALVHFFVVKEDKPDQQDVPKLTKHVIVESALTMDFKAQDKTAGEITFTVSNPGCYLLRVEIKGAAKGTGDPFAAMDLVVR